MRCAVSCRVDFELDLRKETVVSASEAYETISLSPISPVTERSGSVYYPRASHSPTPQNRLRHSFYCCSPSHPKAVGPRYSGTWLQVPGAWTIGDEIN